MFGYYNIYLLYGGKWLTSMGNHTSNVIFSNAREMVNLL